MDSLPFLWVWKMGICCGSIATDGTIQVGLMPYTLAPLA